MLPLRKEDVHLHYLQILYCDRLTSVIFGLSERKFHKYSFGDDWPAEGMSGSIGFRLDSIMVPVPADKVAWLQGVILQPSLSKSA